MTILVVSLALNLLSLIVYIILVRRTYRAMSEIYEIVNRRRAYHTIMVPWRAIEIMKEDLKIKNSALKLADDLGIDTEGLLTVATERGEEK